MSKMKDLAIDSMNARRMYYEVTILQPDGPDDCQWVSMIETPHYTEAVRKATELYDKGHVVKMYDPFTQKETNFEDMGARYGIRKTTSPDA